MTCPTCGFDPRTVSPSDAAVAARSFPRRYRAVLVRPEDQQDRVTRRPAPDRWSAAEHGAFVAAALSAAADAVDRYAVNDNPMVGLDPGEPPSEPSVEATLTRLENAATKLATAVERYPADRWSNGGLDAAREGVHLASHHLREAQRAVDDAR
ncbi:MAG TPA: hypothetical protein VM938_13695 [Acidimicrobiales bacterium]|nr:hypothetical protein [Acidimicrobiales bacterium]